MTRVSGQRPYKSMRQSASPLWAEFISKDDWWAIWIGLGLVVVAAGLVASGSSLKWLAVAPQKWTHLAGGSAQLRDHAAQYLALFALWAALFGIGVVRWVTGCRAFCRRSRCCSSRRWAVRARAMGPGGALQPRAAAGGAGARSADLQHRGVPQWADAGLRVELYIKTGIVLLGASLPLTLIAWAGPVAIVQAAIVSLVTFGVIYFVAVRLGLDRRLAATLGTGGAVCGVSGAIAIAGAVGARKEHALDRHFAGDASGRSSRSSSCRWLARSCSCRPASPAPGSALPSSPTRRVGRGAGLRRLRRPRAGINGTRTPRSTPSR
jgi:hypothetical protein